MEGCSKYCTFCIVPYTRGRDLPPAGRRAGRSGRAGRAGCEGSDAAGPERQRLARAGGWRERRDGRLCLPARMRTKPRIERLRYTTSHPREMTQRVVDAYARLPKLVSHLHLPVQAGSDRVLAAMKRGYTVLEYKSLVRKLRAARPDISLSSDFIIGFPARPRPISRPP
ncbi:radical SAM protein [Zoogloea sp.]|uniref:radical SAM protein n=1 Tax=Zoogloea sp. TaxID=49181 RepID=UPI00345BF87D